MIFYSSTSIVSEPIFECFWNKFACLLNENKSCSKKCWKSHKIYSFGQKVKKYFFHRRHRFSERKNGYICENHISVWAGSSKWTTEGGYVNKCFRFISTPISISLNFLGDLILSVNTQPLHGVTHQEAINVFKSIKTGLVEMIVGRQQSINPK